jgi:hypothetical protein
MGANQRPEDAEQPTSQWCGSPGKIAVLTARAEGELPLHVAGDNPRKVDIGCTAQRGDGRSQRRSTRGHKRRRPVRL